MRAMILAAGRGERMKTLTEHLPKPLLNVGNHCLIEYTLHNLKQAGIQDVVINISWLGHRIKSALGDGTDYGLNIAYSEESERLETGGGITNALSLLGNNPFLVVSADIISDFPLKALPKEPAGLAHLVVVDNPSYHPRGDFGLEGDFLNDLTQPTFTFANIGVYRPELFRGCKAEVFPLNKLLFPAIKIKQVTGEHYKGLWYNVGTPEDLQQIQHLTLPLTA